MSSHASLASQRPQSARTRLVGVIAAYASAADRRATTRRPRRGFFFHLRAPRRSAVLPGRRLSRGDVLLDRRLERRAVERRVPLARAEELRDAVAGDARGPLRPPLGPPAGGGLVGDVRLGFEPEEKRQVRARQRRGALFFRAAAGGFRLNARPGFVHGRMEGSGFHKLALAAVAAFRRKPGLPRERQLPLRVGERALELRRARGRSRPVRFAEPQGLRRAARPARSSRRNAVRNARTSASSQRERSSARRAAASSRSSAETEPFFSCSSSIRESSFRVVSRRNENASSASSSSAATAARSSTNDDVRVLFPRGARWENLPRSFVSLVSRKERRETPSRVSGSSSPFLSRRKVRPPSETEDAAPDAPAGREGRGCSSRGRRLLSAFAAGALPIEPFGRPAPTRAPPRGIW